MELDGNTFFIYNKKYEHARFAMSGTGDRDLCTYEGRIICDQLWLLEQSSKHPEYYYINNAYYEGYRFAKWGEGEKDVGAYTGHYYEDQLWRFQPEGDYYRIYNKDYPSAKITKWGDGDDDWGTYVGPDYEDQLWKLVPRFKASASEREIWSCDNREGTRDIIKEFKVTTGVKLTNSQSLSTKFGFEYSLKCSLSAGIEGITAGMESTYKFYAELQSSISSSEERSWSKETTTTYTCPAGKNYLVLQTLLDFSSPLDSDNCCLYCSERIKESS